MDTVISKLAEIEHNTAHILEDVNLQKIALAKSMEEKTIAYDQETDADTAKKLTAIKEDYQKTIELELAELKEKPAELLESMDEKFRKSHDSISDEIVRQILRQGSDVE